MKTRLIICRIFLALLIVKYSEAIVQKAPVQLLNLSGDGQKGVTYNEDTIRELFLNPKLKDREVVVISIVGAFRKGKSFLMNYMLRYLYAHYPSLSSLELINPDEWMGDQNEPLTGFDWKSGVERITKGLILWGDVFLYDSPKGDKLAIYIMDTQGLFDHRTTTAENSKIFSLSTLISSIQILNIFNILHEDQLQYLQFATEYARYAATTDDTSAFQNLLILIRDWNSVEEYKYGMRGGNGYLNNFLEIHDHQSRELQSVRRYLRTSFEKIDCFLMPYPSKKVANDRTYDGRWADMDEDFVIMMNELFYNLFKRLHPKRINGNPVKADELLVFINTYVENFNNNTMVEASSVYETTLDNQFKILIAKSVDNYIDFVRSNDGEIQSAADINKLHLLSKEKAMKFFNEAKKFGSYSEGVLYKKDLNKTIEEIYKQWSAVSITQIRKLQEQKNLTIVQIQALQASQNVDNEAKLKLEEANAKAKKFKLALQNAKTDTEQARREAQELRVKFEEAERERAEAIEREERTREQLQKNTQDKEFFEHEYKRLKVQAENSIGKALNEEQAENGFEGFFNKITKLFMQVVPIVTSVIGWLNDISSEDF